MTQPSFPSAPFAPPAHEAAWPAQRLSAILLMLACLLAYAPLYPRLPETGLDPSWMLGMNQAVAQGSIFGRDVVFTFGPYADLYTKLYHPATYPWALGLGLLFALASGAMLLTNLRGPGHRWLRLFAISLFLVASDDALFLIYPLLVILVAIKATQPDNAVPGVWCFDRPMQFVYALAIALLGALPVIKGSFLPLSALAGLAGGSLFWLKGRRGFAALFIALPLLAMAGLWLLAGQPLDALPNYFRSISPIISGYSEAMILPSHFRPLRLVQVTAYLAAAALILAPVLRHRNCSILRWIIVAGSVGFFLFIAFKAGFVRHDCSHSATASSSLVLAAIALNLFGIALIGNRSFIAVIAAWLLISAPFGIGSLNFVPARSLYGLMQGDLMGSHLRGAFDERLRRIQADFQIPQLAGTTDIYPYDQVVLIASGNRWSSRPVLQSYSAYTPALARINEAHLRGPLAPDNIVFRFDTIDERFPALDDGMSWPTLIARYAVSGRDAHYAYFRQRSAPADPVRIPLMRSECRLGQLVSLPLDERPLFAEIDLAPTRFGRLASLAYKPAILHISVTLANGQHQTYRFIPAMAHTGFILSPLIRTTDDFVKLAQGRMRSLGASRVISLSIAPEESGMATWMPDYTLKLYALDRHQAPETSGTTPKTD